jgi:hypothetical protein
VPGGRWQLLVFADHSVREFPGLVEGIGELRAAEAELEALLLPNRQPDLAAEAIAVMGLDIPVVGVDRDFYRRHRVRVMPFVLVLDPTGAMRAGGLANDAERLWMIWQLSQVPVRPGARGPVGVAESRTGQN